MSRDAEARKAMAEASQKETRNEADPKAWKWIIRKRIWDLMEAQNIAQFPRPVHHRIPNFVGAHIAASKVNNSLVLIVYITFLCDCLVAICMHISQ